MFQYISLSLNIRHNEDPAICMPTYNWKIRIRMHLHNMRRTIYLDQLHQQLYVHSSLLKQTSHQKIEMLTETYVHVF